MHHIALYVNRLAVGRRARGLGAAALIDGDIDESSAGFHAFDESAGNKLWGLGAWDQDGADEKVGINHRLFDVGPVGH